LLVELKTPVALDKAIVSVDDVLKLFKARGQELPHPYVINTARQGGAVMSLPLTTGKFQLLPLLVR